MVDRRIELAVVGAVLLLGVLVAPRVVNGYDGGIMVQVADGLARHGTALVHPIDPFELNVPYSGYGLGQSLVMAALMLLPGPDVAGAGMACAILTALIAWVVYRIARRQGADAPTAAIVVAVVVAATPLLVYMASMLSEPGAALGVALMTLGLVRARDGDDGAILVGVGIGIAVLFRADSILLVGVPSIAALALVARRQLARAVVWLAPFLIVWGWYNMARFGSPLTSGYAGQGFTHSFPDGVAGLLVSPSRGLVIHLAVLCVAMLAVRWHRDPLAWFAVVMLGSRVLFFAGWWAWQGGSSVGPRFLLPAIPAFVPLLTVAVQRWRRSTWSASVIAASMALQVAGLAIERQGYGSYDLPPVAQECTGAYYLAAATSSAYAEATDRIQFDWSRFPGLGEPSEQVWGC